MASEASNKVVTSRWSRSDNSNVNDDFTPREYQTILYEKAKEENMIICLGTGTGKTFISVMLIREKSGPLRIGYEKGGQLTVFTVPTKPLAYQHASTISAHTDLKVKVYTGDHNVDEWTKEAWIEEFKKNQVLVMPGEILRQIVTHGILPLSRINLLIFDECHWAGTGTGAHPYAQIMEVYKNTDQSKRPHILGLTPSLISKKCSPDEIHDEINRLSRIMHSKVETSCDIKTLNKYGATPNVETIMYPSPASFEEMDSNCINQLLQDLIHVASFLNLTEHDSNELRKIKKSLDCISKTARTMGIWSAFKLSEIFSNDIASYIEVHQSSRRSISHVMSTVKTTIDKCIALLGTRLKSVDKHYDKLIKFASPKMRVLLEQLKLYSPINEQNRNKKPLCGIVFVEQKKDVFLISLWLKEIAEAIPDAFGFLKVNYVVGHNINNSNLRLIRNQEEVLTKFRKHELNLLVSTSVLEEGLDVPRCNLVIRYDFPAIIRQYIQSKGRARSDGSRYVVFCTDIKEEKAKQDKLLGDYMRLEEMLSQGEVSKHPANGDIENNEEVELVAKLMDKYTYYPTGDSGDAVLNLNSAIQVINRYCMKLPSDSFTKLVPRAVIKNHGDGSYVCELRLPINSPLRTAIISDPAPSKKLAKKIAAYQACVELHKLKELDDNLLPVGKENLKNLCDELGIEPYGEEFEQIGKDSKDKPRPGTTKRRQYYTKLTADVLRGPPPLPDRECYLYVYAMRLSSRIPDEQNTRKRKISDPAETTRSFGIIIPHKLPEIPSFPVFTRSGEVTVSLEEASTNIVLTKEQIEKISAFHEYNFHSVLKVDPFPIKYDISEANSNHYLVPVQWNKVWNCTTLSWQSQQGKPDAEIDWQFLDKVEDYKLRGDHTPNTDDIKNFVFKESDFEDAVVKRWYFPRVEYFYVAEICHSENPLSPFPDTQYKNYVHYYREKYDVEPKNHHQPLLDVDHTSARLNLLTPRYVNRKGVSLSTTKKEKKENIPQKLHLIPELVSIHPYPASFWRKTVTLPCILYRMNVLLLAEQLRSRIAKDILIGPISLSLGKHWPPLDFGWPLTEPVTTHSTSSTPFEKPDSHNTTPKASRQQVKKHPPKEPLKENVFDATGQGKTGSTEFLIDTFDPEKHRVDPEKHRVDDEEEANELLHGVDAENFLNGGTFEISIGASGPPLANWQRENRPHKKAKIVELDDSDEPVAPQETIRGGSPSLLEEAAWDAATDSFITVGFPVGLERISVTNEINAETLCRDLKKQPDFEDFYDSDDSIDDEDDENDEDYEETYSQGNNDAMRSSPPTIGGPFPFQLLDSPMESDDQENRFPGDMDAAFRADPQLNRNNDILKEELSKLVSNSISPYYSNDKGEEAKKKEDEEVPDDLLGPNETHFGELLPKSQRIRDSSIVCDLKFDAYKSDLTSIVGPSPNEILQALTMSNASDGINLERLETVGDSFLKYAVTLFLYCKCPNLHEGKLSYLRSRQISNYNLYRLGKRKGLGEYIIATKFEPNDNWLPPGYYIPRGLDEALVELGADAAVDLSKLKKLDIHSIKPQDKLKEEILKNKDEYVVSCNTSQDTQPQTFKDVDREKANQQRSHYNLISQQSIPDKSIADCVEALIGAYLLHSGPKGALYFMRWLGLKVMPDNEEEEKMCNLNSEDPVWHHMPPIASNSVEFFKQTQDAEVIDLHRKQMEKLYADSGLENFERNILNYEFKDKSYLVQAFTHNSYYENQITDCYQRLEFLGDAILDYLVTRMLYEDQRKHSPGILTDLRSALVNNTFFASLAVEYEFHKYLKNTSHDLYKVMNAFVNSSLAKSDTNSGSTGLLQLYRTHCSTIIGELETENLGDVEVPKALGDIFESVAGAIFLDSGMSLDAVWKVYYPMMKPEIEHFSENVPKSPIRELLELEPQNAQFG